MILDVIKTIILGIIEGITEWLPISSTGHMILLNEFIKLNKWTTTRAAPRNREAAKRLRFSRNTTATTSRITIS